MDSAQVVQQCPLRIASLIGLEYWYLTALNQVATNTIELKILSQLLVIQRL